jgi:hypothetical protein
MAEAGIAPCFRREIVSAAKAALLRIWIGEGRLRHAGFSLIGLLLLCIELRLHILRIRWRLIRGYGRRRDGREGSRGQSALALLIAQRL